MKKTNNLRVSSFLEIPSPGEVILKLPISEKAEETVVKGRNDIEKILSGEDSRKVVIVGPCSIHDYKAATRYAEKLNELRKKVEDKFVIVMRVFFEKPRTTVGWKGFVYDPFLDGSDRIGEGLMLARKLLMEINEMGLPTGTEVLGPIVIQYYSDLISWSAIGARTTESQTHRELASGLSMPVGFKNGTEGNVDIALNAMLSANSGHSFLGIDDKGRVSVVQTMGNPFAHLILRGGKNGPNYSSGHIEEVKRYFEKAGTEPRIIVDCSHANSEKDYRKQGEVWKNVIGQIDGGENVVKGLMLESNLFAGAQKIGEGQYGVSITDGCVGFEETERLILGL